MAPMAMDWRTAYFQQARSDYDMLLMLMKDENVPQCQRLHYLQMATEKLSKGFLTQPGGPRYAKVHDAFVKFIKKSARLNPDLQRACEFKNAHRFALYLDGLADLAQAVENLSPEGSDHANPEYPWEQGGLIVLPVTHYFSDLDFQKSPKMIKLLKFIDNCFAIV